MLEDTHPRPITPSVSGASGRPKSDQLAVVLAGLAGGLVMVRQAIALGPVVARVKVAAVAALLAFCSPYPIRFAIEGKSYAVLVLLVALAWWWRRSGIHRTGRWLGWPD